MHPVGHSLRTVSALRRGVQAPQLASTSRVLVWEARRHASFGNPFEWVRKTLAPTFRDKKSAQATEEARRKQAEEGNLSVFDSAGAAPSGETTPTQVKLENKSMIVKNKSDHHKYSTANFKISHRKLNKLGRQISGKPIDSAILQMTFSEKRASKRIRNMLVIAKQHAELKGINVKKMVVSESWVTKGPRSLKRLEIKGRMKHGIRVHPDSRLSVVLREGKTRHQLLEEDRQRKLKRIVSAGLVREDRPLRNVGSTWAW
ncbi:mitochondrial 50S ribosomal protein L22 [Auriscalpium vulgare]|uniref:Mitochondrial 50S ribosomal protein L22 n=1 Tax=Auriscalpium vulgare TaxID=40419 RepID=A0ACB8SCF9_9AGAM|nr:mitochondrial 50S ribosomal protein L22 [Auriscalpium vulgare]